MRLCYLVLLFILIGSISCCHASPKIRAVAERQEEKERAQKETNLGKRISDTFKYDDEPLDYKTSQDSKDEEVVFRPKKIPKLTKEQKMALIRESGQNPGHMRRHARHHGGKKNRRSLDRLDAPWRRYHVVGPIKPSGQPMAVNIHKCPMRIDAITQAHNRRSYVFAGEYVYQVWRDNGLQQKAAFMINEMFPGGPRHVSAAMTNLRSGVTILIDYKTVYRYRWNRKEQRFYLARKSPQKLIEKVDFIPRLAFQWVDGNMILMEGDRFATYDPYWNIATFIGRTSDYFPNISPDTVGLAHNGGTTFLFMTARSTLQVYSTKKFDIMQEYPIRLEDYVACSAKI